MVLQGVEEIDIFISLISNCFDLINGRLNILYNNIRQYINIRI